MSERLSQEEFVHRAIRTLRTPKSKGIHSVYSGFNEAFKRYFDGLDPVQATTALAADGKIEIRPVRGGVMLYLPGEAPTRGQRGDEALKQMGLE